MDTIFEPKYLGPFNPNYGYFVYDPSNGEVTAFCFDPRNNTWDYSTWSLIESGLN